MKYLIHIVAVAISVFGFAAEPQIKSQAEQSKEEQAKVLEDCITPDRPKPFVEGNMKRNSVLCGKAISLPKPSYPEEAKAQKISGDVSVEIVIDERGTVVWAKALNGHPFLTTAAVKAACRARYSPTEVSGRPIKTHGVIGYKFVND